jgi:nucleoside-diphosphate-sugar epimerase
MPTVFITAASGRIGSKLIPLLVSEGSSRLILPTTNAARLTSSLPKSDLITVVEGSIQDPQWVEAQLRANNVDTVFLCLTGTDELFTTMNIFSALQRTPSMKHVVYLSACGNFTAGFQTLRGWKAAHGIVKALVEAALQELSTEMGFTYTILGPTLFFDNDLRQKGAILNGGIYPEPLGMKGASRVSTDDIAEAVKIAVFDQGGKWNGKKIMLGSRKRYNVSVPMVLVPLSWN